MSKIILKIWHLYKPYALHQPIKTKMITAFGLFFVADSICQILVENSKKWDKKRTFIAALVAGGIVNPLN